ncbi:MAG: hypothetical protein ABW039_14250 [Sphingobium sp.]
MTWAGRKGLAIVGLAGALALGGCAYDDGYGYGGVSVGTGYYAGGGYYDDYYGSPYGYGPSGYTGWYDGYYYPGSGYYVYDRGGRRQRWNDGQRRYWEGRRNNRGDRPDRPHWNDGQQAGQPTAPRPRPQWRGRDDDGNRNWGEQRRQSQPGSGGWQRRSDTAPSAIPNANAAPAQRSPWGAGDGGRRGDGVTRAGGRGRRGN